jgi:hypothetical protein
MLDAAVAASALTTGALLAFGRSRGGMWAPFASVGRRAAGGGPLEPPQLEVLIGVGVHLGQMVALGAATALLLGGGRVSSRLRAALLVVLAWELAARLLPWLPGLRVDAALGLPLLPRVGLAAVLVLALAFAPRRDRVTDAA